jgi:hypothetical protein
LCEPWKFLASGPGFALRDYIDGVPGGGFMQNPDGLSAALLKSMFPVS